MEASVGDEVMIFGGVSHLCHGRIDSIDARYERLFALVRLRRKDGKLSRGKMLTLVPLFRCIKFDASIYGKKKKNAPAPRQL